MWITVVLDNADCNDKVGEFMLHPFLCRAESAFVFACIYENEHGCNHGHIHGYLQPVLLGGEEMGKVEILFDELEKDFNHPSPSIHLQHCKSLKIHDIGYEIYNMHLIINDFAICIKNGFSDLGLDMPIDSVFRVVFCVGKQTYGIVLNDFQHSPVFGDTFYPCRTKRIDHMDTPLVGYPDKIMDIVGSQISVFRFGRESSVYDIEVLVKAFCLCHLLDEFGYGVVFILMLLVVMESNTCYRESVKTFSIFDVFPPDSLFVCLAGTDVKAGLKMVAGLCNKRGINGNYMVFNKFQRSIQLLYLIIEIIVCFLKEFYRYSVDTPADAAVVHFPASGTGREKVVERCISERLADRSLRKPDFCQKHIQKKIEYDSTLKHSDPIISLGLNSELRQQLLRDIVKNLSHTILYRSYSIHI